MTRYKIADVVLEGEFLYDYTPAICKEYLYEGDEECLLSVKMTEEDIAKEMALAPEFSARYLESLAFFRKICEYILEKKDGIIFHSSAIAVDGKAYLFTAPSGTGKSTHARLWREMLGDKRYGCVNNVLLRHKRSCNSCYERIEYNVGYTEHQYKSENGYDTGDPGVRCLDLAKEFLLKGHLTLVVNMYFVFGFFHYNSFVRIHVATSLILSLIEDER